MKAHQMPVNPLALDIFKKMHMSEYSVILKKEKKMGLENVALSVSVDHVDMSEIRVFGSGLMVKELKLAVKVVISDMLSEWVNHLLDLEAVFGY